MALWRSVDRGKDNETKDAVSRRHSAGPNYQFAGIPYSPPLGELDIDRAVDDAWGRVIWVYRAIDARAKNASRLTVRINNGRGLGATEIENHPVAVALNRQANRYETGQAFRYRLHTQLDLSKRGVFVEAITSRSGDVKELHLLNPKHTWPIPDPDKFVSGFQMRLPSGETFDMPVFKEGKGGVLWIRRPHPTDPYSSSTWLDAAGISIDLDHYARVYNRNFLYNDGRPGGLLLIGADSDIDPTDAAILQQRMSGGPGSAGRVTIMEADQAQYVDTSTTPRDAQYVESRALTKGEILAAAGTPESLWNASGRTFDNADAELESWWRNEMVPECEAVASYWEQLTKGGITNDDEVVTYAWEEISVLSRDERELEQRLASEFMNGTISLDEYRTGTGKLPMDLPGSRVAWLTAGKAPVGTPEDVAAIMGQGQQPTDGQTPPPDSEPPPGGDGGGDTPPTDGTPPPDGNPPPGGDAPPTNGGPEQGPPTSEDPIGDILLGQTETKALTNGTDGFAQQRAVQAALLDKWETAVADEIATLIRRQENVVLARLTGAKARKHTRHWVPKEGAPVSTPRELKALDSEYVIDRRRWIDEVVAAIADIVLAAFGASGRFMLAQLLAADDEDDQFDPGDAAGEIVAKTVRVIAEGFDARAGRLQEIVTGGDKAGKTIEQIADDVKEAFTSAETWAAVSSRQVVGAMNAAQTLAATQAGAVKKRWLATDDERTRLTHREAEGQVVDMTDPFTVGAGELQFPGDPTGPIGEWINCRCTMLFQTAERDFDAELDADLAELDAFESKGLIGRAAHRLVGSIGSFDVRFDPLAHPRDHRGRFVDTPDVRLPDGTAGVAVGSNPDGTVTVAKPTGAVVTVAADRLVDPPKPKPVRTPAVDHRPLTPLVSPNVAPRKVTADPARLVPDDARVIPPGKRRPSQAEVYATYPGDPEPSRIRTAGAGGLDMIARSVNGAVDDGATDVYIRMDGRSLEYDPADFIEYMTGRADNLAPRGDATPLVSPNVTPAGRVVAEDMPEIMQYTHRLRSFGEPFRVAMYQDGVPAAGSYFPEGLVGFVDAYREPNGNVNIGYVATRPGFEKQGIASTLMDKAVEGAPEIDVGEVMHNGAGAIVQRWLDEGRTVRYKGQLHYESPVVSPNVVTDTVGRFIDALIADAQAITAPLGQDRVSKPSNDPDTRFAPPVRDGLVLANVAPLPKDPGPEPEWDARGVPVDAASTELDAVLAENRKRRNTWKRDIRRALARGVIANEQARERGYCGQGHDQTSDGRAALNWQPLPDTLYHVTTARSGVEARGLLARDELDQTGGAGLGGGDADTVSFTTDPGIADDILRALNEYNAVLNGRMTPRT